MADSLALAWLLNGRWFCVLFKRLCQVLEVAIALDRLRLLLGSLLSEEKCRLLVNNLTVLLWLRSMSRENLAHKLLESLDLSLELAAHFCGSKPLNKLLRAIAACVVD